jgi:AAA family ATPase
VAAINAELIRRIVDLKYVLSTQVVQIQYESRTHLFSLATATTRTRNARGPDSNISESLGALSMDDATHIYIVDWDTIVTIEDNVQVSEPKPQTVKKFSSLHSFI